MRRYSRKATTSVVLVVTLVICVVIAVILFVASPPSPPASPSTTVPSPAQEEPQPSKEQQPAIERDALTDAVRAFEEAFHTYDYQDTPRTRLERIQPYATEAFMVQAAPDLEFGNSPADQSFIEDKLAVKGLVSESDGEFLDETTACVTTLVETRVFDRAGLSEQVVPLTTRRYWVNTPAGWKVHSNVQSSAVC